MADQKKIKIVPAGKGPVYWGPGDQMRFLLTGEETGGAFFMSEITVAAGGGPPPHIHHREDESFYLQQGTLIIHVGDKTLQASPGDFVHLPRGIVHFFKNMSDEPAKMLVTCAPAGIENFFMETFYPAKDGVKPPPPTPEMMERLVTAAATYGIEIFPPK